MWKNFVTISSFLTQITIIKYNTFLFLQVGVDISKLDAITDDLDFTEKLIAEESVFCLPGKVIKNSFSSISLYCMHACKCSKALLNNNFAFKDAHVHHWEFFSWRNRGNLYKLYGHVWHQKHGFFGRFGLK